MVTIQQIENDFLQEENQYLQEMSIKSCQEQVEYTLEFQRQLANELGF